MIQEGIARIRVKVVPTNKFTEHRVQENCRQNPKPAGAATYVTVEKVDHIARTPAGKFQAVVSLLGDAESKPKTPGVRPRWTS